jgi:hypothetical protein
MIYAAKIYKHFNIQKSPSNQNATFGRQNGALMSPKGANMFSGNEFCRIWDIRQNNLG